MLDIKQIYLYWEYNIKNTGVDWNNIKNDIDALDAISVLIEEKISNSSNINSHSYEYGKLNSTCSRSYAIKIDLSNLCKFVFDITDICNETDENKRKIKKYSAIHSTIKTFIIPILKGTRRLINEEKCICLLICDLVRKTNSNQISISKIKETIKLNIVEDEGIYCPFEIKCEKRNKENTNLCSYFKITKSTENNILKNVDVLVDELVESLCKKNVLININGIIKIPTLIEIS